MYQCFCCDQTLMPHAATACGLCGGTLCDDCRQPIDRPALDVLTGTPPPQVPPDAKGWLCPPCVASLLEQGYSVETGELIDPAPGNTNPPAAPAATAHDPHQQVT